MGTNFDLPIHQATLDYIGGIDAELEWEARGISAHNQKDIKELEMQREKAKQFLNTEKGEKKLYSFLEESRIIFQKLLSKNDNWFKEYFANQKFIFIIGAMRTAGTYLYKELNQTLNINLEKLNRKMVHDSIPTYVYVEKWKDPKNWN